MAQNIGEKLSRSRSRSSDHNQRLEPHLLRAAEADDVDELRQILDSARKRNQLNDNFLRIGLMRSAEKGKDKATQFLLDEGAPPDGAPGNRLSPLLRAVERDHKVIVHKLLEHGAKTETPDKKGRTALMTAAWKNHWHILNSLIIKGANVNAKDLKGRNVLHNLAADKQCDWGDSVIELLLSQNVHIDGPEGQDDLGRSPLHWACATGKKRLAELLIFRTNGPRADISAVEIRGKTSLHLAASHGWDDIVELLLAYNADIHAKSDGAWTALHNAAEKGFVSTVRILLGAGSDINAKLLTGITPLHLAAQGGHTEVVKCFLERKDLKRAARDSFGSTAFLRAAQNRHKEIVNLLAPFNHLESMSQDALGACNGFNATIVDFGNFRNENRVVRRTVYELLYGRDPINPRKPKLTILPNEKASEFRWIHLPANNMAWIEVLITKLFIEEGASDIEGYKALERSFSHQHRGQQTHSHFMRPLCQTTTRAARLPQQEEPVDEAVEKGPPAIVVSGPSGSSFVPKTPTRSSTAREESSETLKASGSAKDLPKIIQKDKGKRYHGKGTKSPKGSEKEFHGGSRHSLETRRPHSPGSPNHSGRSQATVPKGNIFTYMPYLHFESSQRREEMQEAIKRAEFLRAPGCPSFGKAATYDEMLIRAHLATSAVSLHVRRTLDQSFYHNIDTESRDHDQVVYRYQLNRKRQGDTNLEDPKILMVDQMWLWILGKDLVVTAFPQRWQQPKNDPLNVLDSVIEDINNKTREPVRSVYDLAMIITSRCTGVFNKNQMGNEDYQFLDMFESSIGSATDRETFLFKEFNEASAQASTWLQQNRRPSHFTRYLERHGMDKQARKEAKIMERAEEEEKFKFEEFMRSPLFVDKLLDIGKETDLLAETKDIRDELNMIAKVLDDQRSVLPDLQEAICDIYLGEQRSQNEVKKGFREQLKSIEVHLKDIDRMDRQAERIYKSITDMLDLKQKHANAFEARFARDQASSTARQSQTIMVFTIVTIIFLPLSFIASFFAINIRDFPHSETGPSLPLSYVSKYLFGIGFAVSIPLVAIALSLDDISDIIRQIRHWNTQRKLRNELLLDEAGSGRDALGVMKLEQAISMARKSVETEWIRERLSTGRRPGTAGEREGQVMNTGFRIRDVERGLEVSRKGT